MAIEYKGTTGKYYGTRAERLADVNLVKGNATEFYENDTGKEYISDGANWSEVPKKTVEKLVITPLAQVLTEGLTLSADTVVDSYTISVTDGTQFSTNDLIKLEENGIYSKTFHAVVLSINVNELTLDRPVDSIYTAAGASISRHNYNAKVNGSVTPVVFKVANTFDQDAYYTRGMFNIVCTDAALFNSFGDIAGGLTRGIQFRKKLKDGSFVNLFNAKTNNRLQLIMYDVTFFDSTLPFNVNGLSGRLTFEKLGSEIILEKDEELQMVVQDDLTGLISFELVVEGYIKQG